ncbi:MAG: hypothetical protein V3T70_06970 [Phycisphaerae bacterium]
MIQCSECEFFERGPEGRVRFRCDPFANIKEPECLTKWQLLRLAEVSSKLDRIVSAHEAQAEMYRRLGPIQEKMFRYMEREIESAEDTDAWKSGSAEWDDDEEDDEEDGDDTGFTPRH